MIVYEHIFSVPEQNPNLISEFIAYKLNDVNTLKKVDSFKPLMNNPNPTSEDIDITLKIVLTSSFVNVVIEASPRYMAKVTSDFWVQISAAED